MPAGPMQTRFFESDGAQAEERLRELGDALRGQGARVTLLASRDERGVFLLVAEGRTLPATPVPQGVRVWTFERLEM